MTWIMELVFMPWKVLALIAKNTFFIKESDDKYKAM